MMESQLMAEQDATWRGKRLGDMDRYELISAVVLLMRMYSAAMKDLQRVKS